MSRSGTTTRDRGGRSRRRAERQAATGATGGATRAGGGRRGPERHGNRRRGSARRPSGPVTPLARRRARLRPRQRRLVQLGALVVAAAAIAWLLLAGPVLAVRAVQVDGLRTLPADQVQEAAGIASGTPLLRVDVDAAEARVARLPQVADVEVTRDWPDSVVITVVERVPVAVVGEAGWRSLIDADGVLFDMVTGAPPEGVVPLDVAAPGPDDPATLAGVAAVGSLPAAVRAQVSGAAATGPDDISLTLTDGTVVRWGDATESGEKSAALVGLLEQIAAGALEPATTIDVSTPDSVVLR
ncbi:cell division protein FtsQ/DivIB [Blastococcus haudaquaticus]|uniref:Cell division protein FtsQ n=1 Tax=Blastococcus haudaquaticus TaxID=1938745 RepID=A0A286H682_9ACTN|nr:FtsQ-type POTRA domain-containing protein [Blastococcus haudaquaticus]SOE02774.1 cell division protein FtsQ [Blastococcus haudaquaticus]